MALRWAGFYRLASFWRRLGAGPKVVIVEGKRGVLSRMKTAAWHVPLLGRVFFGESAIGRVASAPAAGSTLPN